MSLEFMGEPLYCRDEDTVGVLVDALIITKTLDDGVIHHRIMTTLSLGSVEADGMIRYAMRVIEYDFLPHCTCHEGDTPE